MAKYRAIPQGFMTVGEVAKKMGVTVRTLQYYDKEGLLSPSAESKGGRRLYTDKDLITLHQIISLKSLGFSLDDIKERLISLETPADVANALTEQADDIRQKIEQLQASLSAIEQLKAEVLQMQTVNFKKYADIIVNLQMKNDSYYLIKRFDDDTLDHIRSQFDKESGLDFMDRFNRLSDEIVQLQKENVPPESEKCQQVVKEYWGLIMEFTNGDMSMLPKLVEVGNIDTATNAWEERQKIVNDYLEPALQVYFSRLGTNPFGGGETVKDAIQVRKLKKSYGSHMVLKGLDFQIEKGEIFALLGVNGAGKTTTLECIEGLRKYDSGAITVKGKMGIQLQSSSLPAHIKPMEAVKLFAKWNKTKIDDVMLNGLGIKEMEKKQYIQLSTGQKRRLHLALALIGNPDVIFLDEPTAGLDVEGRLSLHEQIRKLKSHGKTIVLASHDMAEVETLCDRIAILNNGNIVFCGTASELTDKVARKYFIHIKTQQGDNTFETDNIEDTLISLLGELKQKKIHVLDIKVDRGTLEQHFIEMARREAG